MPIQKHIIAPIMGFLLLNVAAAMIPYVSAAEATPSQAAAWIPEGLQAWGDHDLAVDFGVQGLWSYNGNWIQLSRLDPESMASWGSGRLAVNFGPRGLWTYDGRAWLKISAGPN